MTRHTHRPSFPLSATEQTEGGNGVPQYVPRAIPPNIGIRQPVSLTADDIERQPLKFIALALTHLKEEIAKMAVMVEDRGRPVDEYQPMEFQQAIEQTLVVQPQWETNEKITSIIVTGPPSTAFTLQLGDREWSLLTDTTGRVVFSHIGLYLGRSDNRQLTSVTPGVWTLELMGFADSRGQLI